MADIIARILIASLLLALSEYRQFETLRQLQGEWTSVDETYRGFKDFDDGHGTSTLTVDGTHFTIAKPKRFVSSGRLRIPVSRSPQRIDFFYEQGILRDEWDYGILRIEGDTLTLCLDQTKRPTKFASPKGSMTSLGVWRKVKK